MTAYAFSSNSGINVMIINTQAFAASMNEDKNVEGRKGDAAARIIYTERDEFGSRRPIDVMGKYNAVMSALAELLYRDFRKKKE